MRRDSKAHHPVGGWDRPDRRYAVPVANDFAVMPLGPDLTWDEKIKQGMVAPAMPVSDESKARRVSMGVPATYA